MRCFIIVLILLGFVRFFKDDNGSYQKSLQSAKFTTATARQFDYKLPQKKYF